MLSKANQLVIGLALFAFVLAQVSALQMIGGLDEERPADEQIKKIIASVSKEMERKYPAEFSSIEPLSYRTQLVAGMNYFVKAIVSEKGGKKSHVHMRVYRPLAGDNELTAIKTNVEEKSPLRYFQ